MAPLALTSVLVSPEASPDQSGDKNLVFDSLPPWQGSHVLQVGTEKRATISREITWAFMLWPSNCQVGAYPKDTLAKWKNIHEQGY